MENNRKTLILCLGNILLGDEGFGIHVARRLREIELSEGVSVEEGGVGGFDMLGYLDGVDRLLVVDAMMLDTPPGQLTLLDPGPELSEPGKCIMSFHQVGAMDLVKMWSLLGLEPEIHFLVTRPEKIGWGMELSPSLQSAITPAVEMVKEFCDNNSEQMERNKSLC